MFGFFFFKLFSERLGYQLPLGLPSCIVHSFTVSTDVRLKMQVLSGVFVWADTAHQRKNQSTQL